MRTVLELKTARAKALDSAKAIQAKADAEKRDVTDDELATIESHLAESDSIKAELEAVEKRRNTLAKLDADSAGVAGIPSRKNLGSVLPDGVAGPNAANDWRVTKARFEDDPNKGFKSHREFLGEVLDATVNRAKLSDNLKFLSTAGSDEQGEYADPYGGFLLPAGFSPTVLQLDPEADPMAGRVTPIPMQTAVVDIPARVDKNHSSSVSGGFTVSRSAETAAKTAGRGQFEMVKLTAHNLFGLAYATEELLADSPISFTSLIAAGFNDEFTSAIIDERLNGQGVGEFLGVLNSPCVISVTKETAQVAATITYQNLVDMRMRAWQYANCIWIANHDTMGQLLQINQQVGTGGTLMWQTSAVGDVPDTLFGRPLIFSEYAKTLGTVGDIGIYNWSQYLEGTLQPLQSAESIHVRFLNHERAFKFWLRNAGAPWWRTALTPKNSTVTMSPFVVLATRA